MCSYKKWSISVLVIALLLVTGLMSVNYLIDPLQFYRVSSYPPVFSKEQRYQNPGLAKNYDYDTIVVGTSMTENFLPSYVNQKLGGKMLRLSMSGASAKEQYLMAKLALDTGKVKKVIWGLDYFALRGDPNRVRDEQGTFPYYFYDQNPFNDAKYLLNMDTTIDASKIALCQTGLISNPVCDGEENLETLNTWLHYSYGKEKVLQEWNRLAAGGSFAPSEYEFANIKRNIDENFLSLVTAHPEVEFIFYQPPYSVLQHRYFFEKNKTLFENELETKRYFFEQVKDLHYVKVYDFQQESKITFHLEKYKDLAHHSPDVNNFIIDAIVKGEYMVSERNLEKSLQELKKQVESLQVNKL